MACKVKGRLSVSFFADHSYHLMHFFMSMCSGWDVKFNCFSSWTFFSLIFEPPRGKTNNVVSEQVQHKPACAATEKS